MSEQYWQVSSTVSGGNTLSVAAQEEYSRLARSLSEAADSLKNAGALWQSTAFQLRAQRAQTSACTAFSGGLTAHTTLPYDMLDEDCAAHAQRCTELASNLDTMATLLIRAHGLYAESESIVQRLFTEGLQLTSSIQPLAALLGTGLLAAGGLLHGLFSEGKVNLSLASTSTASIQEGVLGALASWIAGTGLGSGLFSTNEVNDAAEHISSVTSGWKDNAQGNVLTVREVYTDADVVRGSSSVIESLENLRRLAEERLGKIDLASGLSYATIAIQRYEREDGSSAWLVTIPGTDGQEDSPFGWEQNIELMSSNSERRMQADSIRMVTEAMEQAGIGSDEPVALIGHSQGGIVAAAVAADFSKRYNIEHVVTAGSPIANHPIPNNTWVTSIEIEDELVAALDGAANPATEHWMTVRGQVSQTSSDERMSVKADGSCSPAVESTDDDEPLAAAKVPGSTENKEISHWIKYHQAAYQNATDLGSSAVTTHEQHFQQVIAGTLKETHYYEGRMSH